MEWRQGKRKIEEEKKREEERRGEKGKVDGQ